MESAGVQEPVARPTRQWLVWTGRVVSVLPVLVILTSARWKLTEAPTYVAEFARIGWPHEALPRLAVLQLSFMLVYVFPRTSVLGAVLLTGYLGGAIASYVRIGEYSPPLVPLTTALLAWLGIYLREPRLWTLLPWRGTARHNAPNTTAS
jgi:hypothetical protein